jgi:hypothetical protein
MLNFWLEIFNIMLMLPEVILTDKEPIVRSHSKISSVGGNIMDMHWFPAGLQVDSKKLF